MTIETLLTAERNLGRRTTSNERYVKDRLFDMFDAGAYANLSPEYRSSEGASKLRVAIDEDKRVMYIASDEHYRSTNTQQLIRTKTQNPIRGTRLALETATQVEETSAFRINNGWTYYVFESSPVPEEVTEKLDSTGITIELTEADLMKYNHKRWQKRSKMFQFPQPIEWMLDASSFIGNVLRVGSSYLTKPEVF